MTGSDTYLLLPAAGVMVGVGEGFSGGVCGARPLLCRPCGEKLRLGECVSAKVREARREPLILDVSGRGGRWAVTRKKEEGGRGRGSAALTGPQQVGGRSAARGSSCSEINDTCAMADRRKEVTFLCVFTLPLSNCAP